MNNFLKLAEPHLIFLIIIFLVVSYKIVISLLKATKNNTFDEVVKKATKNPGGYSDETIISSVFKEWWTFIISPVEENLAKSRINPNFLTFMSFTISFLTCYLYAADWILSLEEHLVSLVETWANQAVYLGSFRRKGRLKLLHQAFRKMFLLT